MGSRYRKLMSNVSNDQEPINMSPGKTQFLAVKNRSMTRNAQNLGSNSNSNSQIKKNRALSFSKLEQNIEDLRLQIMDEKKKYKEGRRIFRQMTIQQSSEQNKSRWNCFQSCKRNYNDDDSSAGSISSNECEDNARYFKKMNEQQKVKHMQKQWQTAYIKSKAGSQILNFFSDLQRNINIFGIQNAFEESDGSIQHRPDYIAKKYLKGWFFIDVISSFPFQHLQVQKQGFDYQKLLRLFRLPRLFRMLRLIKVIKQLKFLRENQFFEKFERKIKSNSAILRMIQFMAGAIISTHITACFFYLAAKFEDFGPETWVARMKLQDKDQGDQYLYAFYWSTQTVLTAGFGDIHALTELEMILSLFWMVFGIGFYSFIIGNYSSIIAGNIQIEASISLKIKSIKDLAKRAQIPFDLLLKIKKFIENNFESLYNQEEESQLIKVLPPSLRDEVLSNTFGEIIETIKFFKDLKDPDFLWKILPLLRPVKLEKGDTLYWRGDHAEDIYFVLKGAIKLYTERGYPYIRYEEGSFFGDSETLLNLPRDGKAIAMTHLKMMVLKADHMFEKIFENQEKNFMEMIFNARKKRNHHLRLIQTANRKYRWLQKKRTNLYKNSSQKIQQQTMNPNNESAYFNNIQRNSQDIQTDKIDQTYVKEKTSIFKKIKNTIFSSFQKGNQQAQSVQNQTGNENENQNKINDNEILDSERKRQQYLVMLRQKAFKNDQMIYGGFQQKSNLSKKKERSQQLEAFINIAERDKQLPASSLSIQTSLTHTPKHIQSTQLKQLTQIAQSSSNFNDQHRANMIQEFNNTEHTRNEQGLAAGGQISLKLITKYKNKTVVKIVESRVIQLEQKIKVNITIGEPQENQLFWKIGLKQATVIEVSQLGVTKPPQRQKQSTTLLDKVMASAFGDEELSQVYKQFDVLNEINKDKDKYRDSSMKPKYTKSIQKRRAEFKSVAGSSIIIPTLSDQKVLNQSSASNLTRYYLKRSKVPLSPSIAMAKNSSLRRYSQQPQVMPGKTIRTSKRAQKVLQETKININILKPKSSEKTSSEYLTSDSEEQELTQRQIDLVNKTDEMTDQNESNQQFGINETLQGQLGKNNSFKLNDDPLFESSIFNEKVINITLKQQNSQETIQSDMKIIKNGDIYVKQSHKNNQEKLRQNNEIQIDASKQMRKQLKETTNKNNNYNQVNDQRVKSQDDLFEEELKEELKQNQNEKQGFKNIKDFADQHFIQIEKDTQTTIRGERRRIQFKVKSQLQKQIQPTNIAQKVRNNSLRIVAFRPSFRITQKSSLVDQTSKSGSQNQKARYVSPFSLQRLINNNSPQALKFNEKNLVGQQNSRNINELQNQQVLQDTRSFNSKFYRPKHSTQMTLDNRSCSISEAVSFAHRRKSQIRQNAQSPNNQKGNHIFQPQLSIFHQQNHNFKTYQGSMITVSPASGIRINSQQTFSDAMDSVQKKTPNLQTNVIFDFEALMNEGRVYQTAENPSKLSINQKINNISDSQIEQNEELKSDNSQSTQNVSILDKIDPFFFEEENLDQFQEDQTEVSWQYRQENPGEMRSALIDEINRKFSVQLNLELLRSQNTDIAGVPKSINSPIDKSKKDVLVSEMSIQPQQLFPNDSTSSLMDNIQVEYFGDPSMLGLVQFNADMSHIAMNIFETYTAFDMLNKSQYDHQILQQDTSNKLALIQQRQQNVEKCLECFELQLIQLIQLEQEIRNEQDYSNVSFIQQDASY
eukprot:403363320